MAQAVLYRPTSCQRISERIKTERFLRVSYSPFSYTKEVWDRFSLELRGSRLPCASKKKNSSHLWPYMWLAYSIPKGERCLSFLAQWSCRDSLVGMMRNASLFYVYRILYDIANIRIFPVRRSFVSWFFPFPCNFLLFRFKYGHKINCPFGENSAEQGK
jgi:hypothetical protein